ncbi:MAG: hypothetical protein ACR2NG_02880, partial [Acidimicrobiia bacterium]
MGWILAIAVLVTIGALVALVVAIRRLQVADATMQSVSAAVGASDSTGDLAADVRSLVERERRAEAIATRRGDVLDRAPVGVVVVSNNGSVSFANDVANNMLAEVEASSILRTRVLGLTRTVLASGTVESIEVDVHEPERRVLSMTASPLDGGEGPLDTCVYIEDRTEQRRLDAVRTDFVANASHEL